LASLAVFVTNLLLRTTQEQNDIRVPLCKSRGALHHKQKSRQSFHQAFGFWWVAEELPFDTSSFTKGLSEAGRSNFGLCLREEICSEQT